MTACKRDTPLARQCTLPKARVPGLFLVGLEQGLLPHSRTLNDPVAVEEERRLCSHRRHYQRSGKDCSPRRTCRRRLWGSRADLRYSFWFWPEAT